MLLLWIYPLLLQTKVWLPPPLKEDIPSLAWAFSKEYTTAVVIEVGSILSNE